MPCSAFRLLLSGSLLSLALAAAVIPGSVAEAGPPAAGLGPSAGVGTSSPSPAGWLTDGRPTAGRDGIGRALTLPARPGEWVQLRWPSARRMTAVQIYGTSTGARIAAGMLSFEKGPEIPVGEIPQNSAYPTLLAFPPRSVRWVRFTVTKVVGTGRFGIAEVRVYPKGVTPLRYPPAGDPRTIARDRENQACTPRRPAAPAPGTISTACPVPVSTVRGTRPVTVHAEGLTSVGISAWSADVKNARLSELRVPVVDGWARTTLNFARLHSGPLTVQIRGLAGPALSSSRPTYLQLYNAGRLQPAPHVASAAARGKTLVYREDFRMPLSLSHDGRRPMATYPAGKPEYYGVSQFGDAIFPDPAKGFDNLRIVGGEYLRFRAQPARRTYGDPYGFGRRHLGGIVSSARPGGSGFSARYGYFEARMLAPAAPGTWPAFWLLDSDNLVERRPLGAEVDVVELYGHDPLGACHTTHSYAGGRQTGETARCGQRFASASSALRWHVYGVSVQREEIVYFIDGKVVARAPQVPGGDKPMFFLLDLALGGGWPVQLDPVQNRAALYVDWVRVYT